MFYYNAILFQTYQAVQNITTNERLNSHRYDYMKDGNGKFLNPFDQGFVKNLKEFFHMKQPLELLDDGTRPKKPHSIV